MISFEKFIHLTTNVVVEPNFTLKTLLCSLSSYEVKALMLRLSSLMEEMADVGSIVLM